MTYGSVSVDSVVTSSGQTLGAGNATSFKNRIINGAMVIDQRNAGALVNPAVGGTYYLDRWVAASTAASKYSIGQNAGSVTPPTGFTNYLGCTSLSAYTAGASEVFNIQQRIEGLNVTDLGWGTASAQSVTLSFWVRSSLTGIFGGALKNSASDRSYPFIYTISAANTWEQKSVTITGDTTGTWLTTNGIGINIIFSIGAGATLSGTAGAWAAANYSSATGATSVVGTSGATFYITGVQFEVGSAATSFDRRPYGTELALCQRYYETNYSGVVTGTASYAGYLTGVAVSNTVPQFQPYGAISFNVAKRTAPTVTIYGNQGGSGKVSNYTGTDLAASSGSVNNSSIVGFNPYNGVAGTLTTTFNFIIYNYTASAEL
jgi:hypothetical protein